MEISIILPMIKSIVIDPSSEDYFNNKFFDIDDERLNRDRTLLQFHQLRENFKSQILPINTVDLPLQVSIKAERHEYYSPGMIANITVLEERDDIDFKGFLIMELPIIAPELYAALPELTRRFANVYVHNTIGDGYSLTGVDQSKMRKLYWPQPNVGVNVPYWSNVDRLNRVVVINENNKPKMRRAELYSKRIDTMVAFASLDAVDLYGRGWWSRNTLWLPYWLNRRKLLSIYRCVCASKYEVLGQYRFCLCFENMESTGYVTDNFFDCLYEGIIPVYWGAPDINKLIPPEAYIDARKFSSWNNFWMAVRNVTADEANIVREVARDYLNSHEFFTYYNSLKNVIGSGKQVN